MWSDKVIVSTCSLRQWALDFVGNRRRVEQSIVDAKTAGAKVRTGPELELCGYGCEDHFLEMDTVLHCWDSLLEIVQHPTLTHDILCDIGMPIVHKSARYNARVYVLNGKILLIRPKTALADDGNQRESRWFSAWGKGTAIEQYRLPLPVGCSSGCGGDGGEDYYCPIGNAIVECGDCSVASESCEELWTAKNPSVDLSLDGVDIILNGSASFHQLRKLDERMQLILSATRRTGGGYAYANQSGCDGGRLYYDGGAMIAENGQLLAAGNQFTPKDVEMVTAAISLHRVRCFRASIPSMSVQASSNTAVVFHRVPANICLTTPTIPTQIPRPVLPVAALSCPTGFVELSSVVPKLLSPEQEIAHGPALWLWDFLYRSDSAGFFVPVSGGADSASVIAIVGSMCQIIMQHVLRDDDEMIGKLETVLRMERTDKRFPSTHRALAHLLLHTCYMGTSNSSQTTRNRAKALAADIGSYHLDSSIDDITNSFVNVFTTLTGKTPQFRIPDPNSSSSGGTAGGSSSRDRAVSKICEGNGVTYLGTEAEDLALQNIQARSRMAFSYMLGSLLPWVRSMDNVDNNSNSEDSTAVNSKFSPRHRPWLFVLATGNVDEALRGYLTKYDCSSADLNPIGGIAKMDLRMFLFWASTKIGLGYGSLAEVVSAPPTAELRPRGEGSSEATQLDEVEMGMTYEDLQLYGRFRKLGYHGPVSMFRQLLLYWSTSSASAVSRKVKHFFRCYALNRHKATVLTPCYHAEAYSPDDNRYDLRPFLYPIKFEAQFKKIDELCL
eukprot:Lankesteria_metandrocarpae@DN2809_c0_g1_i1.p1